MSRQTMNDVVVNVMDRLVLETLAAGEEPWARLRRKPMDWVLGVVFTRLQQIGFVRYVPITDASHMRLVVTDDGLAFLEAASRARAHTKARVAERVWYWTVGVIDGLRGKSTTAYVNDGVVVCAWTLDDWGPVQSFVCRRLDEFEEK